MAPNTNGLFTEANLNSLSSRQKIISIAPVIHILMMI